MSEIREWTASTGRKFRVPKHRKLTKEKIKALPGNTGCRLDDIQMAYRVCVNIVCPGCIFFNSATCAQSPTKSEFMEFYNQEYKMEEKREIQYREIARTATHVVVEITKQTHRGIEFSKAGARFNRLESFCFPGYDDPIFYLHGKEEWKDRLPICIPLDRFDQFAADVAEYNRTEGGFKTENWRAEKGKMYWFITEYFGVCYTVDFMIGIDDARYKTGNYFRKKDQAEEAAKRTKELSEEADRRVKECLKQYHTEIGE